MAKKKFKWVDGLLVLGLLMVVSGMAIAVNNQEVDRGDKIELVKSTNNDIQVEGNVYIDIEGAVINPGVYELKGTDRVIELLKVCGGLSAEADREWVEKNINKARLLKDGEKIYIPEVLETSANLQFSISNLQTETVLGEQSGLVNINVASLEELDKLPGVGPAIGQRIIDYRQENNGFVSIEEIKLVPGIGDKMFENIKDLIEI